MFYYCTPGGCPVEKPPPPPPPFCSVPLNYMEIAVVGVQDDNNPSSALALPTPNSLDAFGFPLHLSDNSLPPPSQGHHRKGTIGISNIGSSSTERPSERPSSVTSFFRKIVHRVGWPSRSPGDTGSGDTTRNGGRKGGNAAHLM